MPSAHPDPALRINVIIRYPSLILRRQEPESSFTYVYSDSPVEADWHVVVDVLDELVIPNSRENCLFVIAEPPEIRKYDKSALATYGTVVGAPFHYLRGLPNLHVDSGLLPWRVGLGIEFGDVSIRLTRDELCNLKPLKTDTLSVVTSQKADTKLQVQRLRLIDYLSSRIPEMRIYGRDSDPVNDKAEALVPSKYHLALENCRQPRFWTEKLSDSILTENVTFYSGHNRWNEDFDETGAIIEVALNNPREAYESIRRAMDEGTYEAAHAGLRANKSLVFETKNLHAAIERSILQQASCRSGEEKQHVTIPAHRTTKERLTPWRSRPRRTAID